MVYGSFFSFFRHVGVVFNEGECTPSVYPRVCIHTCSDTLVSSPRTGWIRSPSRGSVHDQVETGGPSLFLVGTHLTPPVRSSNNYHLDEEVRSLTVYEDSGVECTLIYHMVEDNRRYFHIDYSSVNFVKRLRRTWR